MFDFQPTISNGLTQEIWLTNLKRTPLNVYQQQPVPYKVQTTHSRHKKKQQTEQNQLTLLYELFTNHETSLQSNNQPHYNF